MKIAFDGKRFFHNSSGLGNYSRDLVRILARYFPENKYLILNKNKSERGADILELSSVEFHTAGIGKFGRQQKLGKNAEKLGADIFHGLSGELPLKWSGKEIKKVVTIHDLIFLRYPQYYSWFDRRIHFWKFKKAAVSADRIIAISEQTKQDIIHYLKADPKKISVVYQGCHQAFKEDANVEIRRKVTEKYKLPERFILNVGTVEPRKNLLSVIQALSGTDKPLVVVGKKTNYYKKIEKLIRKNKMQKQVLFLEGMQMQELAEIYRMADFLVYPSLFEGFGIPVIEALFAGIPVITANTSSLPEAGGKGALYINPSNVADLKAKIIFLWENAAERDRLVSLGKIHVHQFTDESVANELMKAYRSVLS